MPIVTVAGRVCSILGDLIVLFVTWHKTYTTYRAQRGVLTGPSIARVLLYNGTYPYLDAPLIGWTYVLGYRELVLHVSTFSSSFLLSRRRSLRFQYHHGYERP